MCAPVCARACVCELTEALQSRCVLGSLIPTHKDAWVCTYIHEHYMSICMHACIQTYECLNMLFGAIRLKWCAMPPGGSTRQKQHKRQQSLARRTQDRQDKTWTHSTWVHFPYVGLEGLAAIRVCFCAKTIAHRPDVSFPPGTAAMHLRTHSPTRRRWRHHSMSAHTPSYHGHPHRPPQDRTVRVSSI